MTRKDFQILFTALGFLAVVTKGKKTKDNNAKQAHAMAELIEAFCRTSHPDLFVENGDAAELDQIIDELKEDTLLFGQKENLLANKPLLYRIYSRLLQRFQSTATDEKIAGEVEHYLEEEILRNKEENTDDYQRLNK